MFLFDGLFVSGENFFEPIKISAKNFCMAVKRILVFLRMGFDLILQKTLKKLFYCTDHTDDPFWIKKLSGK
jgi:hypothetical protein